MQISEVEELKRDGYAVQGVLRRWVGGTDEDYFMSMRRFNDAVELAITDGKDVRVTEHALGKDWWVKKTPNEKLTGAARHEHEQER